MTKRAAQHQLRAKRPVGDLPFGGCPLFPQGDPAPTDGDAHNPGLNSDRVHTERPAAHNGKYSDSKTWNPAKPGYSEHGSWQPPCLSMTQQY